MKAQSLPFLIAFTLFIFQPSVVLGEDELVSFPFKELACEFFGGWVKEASPIGRRLISIDNPRITCMGKSLEITSHKIEMKEKKGTGLCS